MKVLEKFMELFKERNMSIMNLFVKIKERLLFDRKILIG